MMLMMNAMNMYPNDPLTQLLPLMALSDDDNDDNSNTLMMMALMNPNGMTDFNSILPLMMYNDDSVNLKSAFVYSSILGKGLNHFKNLGYYNFW